jgi:hypothetical protein
VGEGGGRGGRESGEIEDHYKGILGQIGVYLEKELVRVGELGLCVGHDKKNLLDLIQKQYANYTYQFGQLKGALETLVMIVSGKEFTEETKEGGEIVGVGGDALLESGGEIVDILLPNKKKGKKKVEGVSV